MKQIEKLIINSPYEEPERHWHYERESRDFLIREGRRPAGYFMATPNSKSFDDPGIFVEIPLVNQIRPRVKNWRDSGYPGVTGITKRLLDHRQLRTRTAAATSVTRPGLPGAPYSPADPNRRRGAGRPTKLSDSALVRFERRGAHVDRVPDACCAGLGG